MHPHPHQPGLILPSRWNVRQKAAVATLCTLWSYLAVLLKVLELSAGEDGGVGQLAQDGPNIAIGASIFILRFLHSSQENQIA